MKSTACSLPPEAASRLSSAARAAAACFWFIGSVLAPLWPASLAAAAAALRAFTSSSFERTCSTSMTDGGGPDTLRHRPCAEQGNHTNHDVEPQVLGCSHDILLRFLAVLTSVVGHTEPSASTGA